MNNKGFTLVELMAVLAILAIVTLIAVPSVMGFRKQANIKLYCTKVTSIKSAAVLYAQDHAANLTSTYNDDYPSMSITVTDLLDNGYLTKDDANGEKCYSKTTMTCQYYSTYTSLSTCRSKAGYCDYVRYNSGSQTKYRCYTKQPSTTSSYICDPRDGSPMDSKTITVYKNNNRYYTVTSMGTDCE